METCKELAETRFIHFRSGNRAVDYSPTLCRAERYWYGACAARGRARELEMVLDHLRGRFPAPNHPHRVAYETCARGEAYSLTGWIPRLYGVAL